MQMNYYGTKAILKKIKKKKKKKKSSILEMIKILIQKSNIICNYQQNQDLCLMAYQPL